jgi:hypothetical protein
VRVVSVELGKAQGCSAVAAATRVAVVLAAPKSLLKGLNSMQLDRLLGLGSLRLTRFDPNTHAPPKDPFLVLPAPQFRPLVNTLYHHPLPQSSLFSLLTLFNHIIELQVLLWFQKALDLRLLWYPILTVALRTCIIFRQHFCICMVSS